jgi:hypothetical protein
MFSAASAVPQSLFGHAERAFRAFLKRGLLLAALSVHLLRPFVSLRSVAA